MKNKLFGAMLLFFFAVAMSGCQDQCSQEITYLKRTPIWLSLDEMRTNIALEATRELKKPGKIYFYNNYILINEIREGIHLIDNTDPSNPQNVGFIKISGNVDMAIRNNVLYADAFMDLLAIDLQNVQNPKILSREENVFPLPNGMTTNSEGRYLAYYQEDIVTEVMDCNSDFAMRQDFIMLSSDVMTATGIPSNSVGTGGSMARFTIAGSHLYTVDNEKMHTFDLSNAADPNRVNEQSVGWNIETIFPNGDKLFIGSSNGMFIYDIATPNSPQLLSQFSHATACDPVFVDGNTAYVTLRSGNACQGFVNQLDAIDVTNLTSPQLIRSYPMSNPHGLSIANKTMFLCEGEHGLRVLDVQSPENVSTLKEYSGFSTYDVISLPNDLLLVIGSDGFYQYNAADANNLQLLSKIEVAK
jgi:hypothetical protein